MTELQRRALARVALSEAEIETAYQEYKPTDSGKHRLRFQHIIRALCESHERLRAELQGAETLLEEERAEVRSVLDLMDNLASVWGDEGVFRRCRDRLRKLVQGDSK